MNKRIMESRINRKGWGVYIDMNERYWSWESKATLIQVKGKVEKVKIGKRKKKEKKGKKKKRRKEVAENGFDPSTSGLWAQHAPTAPLC